jgi:hypothetical protein
MTTKKKGKKTAKPTAKKRAKEKKGPEAGDKNSAEVRKDLSKLVRREARQMTRAVIDKGKTGQLPTVKFLLEMAGIFPAPATGDEVSTKDEDSLAETLLDRLGIPKTPVVADQYAKEDEEVVMHPAKEMGSDEEESSQLPVVSSQ